MKITEKELKQAIEFFKMPKTLYTNPNYSSLSTNAKTMYMLLFDRLKLSYKNNWIDEYGAIYQRYTVEQFMADLQCSRPTVIKIKKELSDYGLLEEVSGGKGKANILYLHHLESKNLTPTSKNSLHDQSKNLTPTSKNSLQTPVKKFNPINNNTIKTNISITANQEVAAGSGKNPIFEKLKEAFGEMAISGTITQEVEDLLKVHGEPLLMHALNETILNGGRSIRYTRSILERWQGQGLRTVEQVEQNKRDYKNKQSKTDDVPFDQLGRAEDLGF
ncbi:DnaD domain protein [Streptococcus himalayensis]|uniref:DnaD domain protein n=1 Tax=Streptococcus himalayensis TaxID=1888195 RepID=A0A917ABG2_9STRE|nr:DnaD domain protein [Streptococcus himalayensis]QBX08381.1 hypothetical protein JavanS256_0009 [Streptococcus satellite phage Javan256]GGE36910.1 hypothetical protein GCM10011510_17850 [Streptococcus himalayensis]